MYAQQQPMANQQPYQQFQNPPPPGPGGQQQMMMAHMMPQNMMMGGGMAPQQPQLWPMGVGITDRPVPQPGAQDDCSCPPCWCCSRPVWFYDREFQRGGQQESRQRFGCCSWNIMDADVIGTKMSFEGRQCIGVDSCCEPEIHIKNETGMPIGKAIMLLPCTCSCGEVDLCLVKDARGNPKYVRRESVWCPQYRYWSGDFCGWQQYRWPVMMASAPQDRAHPLTHIVMRYHACFGCHPLWVGVEHMPNVPQEDQQLLLGMALCRWWRAEQDQKQDRDANPAY